MKEVRIGLIGTGFMGKAHATAYQNVPSVFGAAIGFKTLYAGPEHPHYAAFFGAPGIGLGYNDQKMIEAYDLIKAIATNTPAYPDVRFAYAVNKVIDAVLLSCAEQRWAPVDR